MDAVRPEVDILLARQIAAAPLLVLRRPLLFEANDHVGTEPLGRFTQQPLQGFGEISRGNPLEVKPRNELLDSFAPAQVRRQDRRAELHPPALGRRIIPYPRLPHLQGARPGHDRPGRLVSIAYHQALAGGITPVVVLLEKLLHLRFNGLLQNLLRPAAHHDIEESASLELFPEAGDFRIQGLLNVAESRSLVHGVSFQPSLGQLMKRTQNHSAGYAAFFSSARTQHSRISLSTLTRMR